MDNPPLKKELWFRVTCVRCGQPLTITFDDDGEVEGNIIQCGVAWSGIFQDWCTPTGLHPEDPGGFKHAFCVKKEIL